MRTITCGLWRANELFVVVSRQGIHADGTSPGVNGKRLHFFEKQEEMNMALIVYTRWKN